MILTGPNAEQFEAFVLGYETSVYKTVEDANWLLVRIEASVRGKKWKATGAPLQAGDLPLLVDWLKSLASDKSTIRSLTFFEPGLWFELIESTEQGVHIRIDLGLEFVPPWLSREDEAAYDFSISLSCTRQELVRLASEFDEAHQRFPPRI